MPNLLSSGAPQTQTGALHITPETKKVSFTISIYPQLAEKIDYHAKLSGASRSSFVQQCLDYAITHLTDDKETNGQ